ncbi:MAG: hypothetical protein MJA84_17895, partial [Firmicutes bacterium]|nr:hypothetical protein [Bacillota bacterium]
MDIAINIMLITFVMVTLALAFQFIRPFVIILLRRLGLWSVTWYRFTATPGWRPLYRLWDASRNWWERVRHFGQASTAGWASWLALKASPFRKGHVLLGAATCMGFRLQQP